MCDPLKYINESTQRKKKSSSESNFETRKCTQIILVLYNLIILFEVCMWLKWEKYYQVSSGRL